MSISNFFFGHTNISDDVKLPEKKNLQETFLEAFECISNRCSGSSTNKESSVNESLTGGCKTLPISVPGFLL